MCRRLATMTEVGQRRRETFAQEIIPNAIDHQTGSDRVLRVRQPLSQFQSSTLLGIVAQRLLLSACQHHGETAGHRGVFRHILPGLHFDSLLRWPGIGDQLGIILIDKGLEQRDFLPFLVKGPNSILQAKIFLHFRRIEFQFSFFDLCQSFCLILLEFIDVLLKLLSVFCLLGIVEFFAFIRQPTT